MAMNDSFHNLTIVDVIQQTHKSNGKCKRSKKSRKMSKKEEQEIEGKL
jgi:hypothetical protein